MADINIVRKPPIWPWIATAIALLLVVGLIVWAANRTEDPQFAGGYTEPGAGLGTEPDMPRAAGTSGTESAAVREYLQFAGLVGDGEQPEPGREHEYTAEGLRKLAAALEALERDQRGAVRDGAADDIRSKADRIQQEPESAKHANAVRDAFMSAAQAMPEADLRDQAQAISPQRPLLEQTDAIDRFFEASAEAVRDASRNI